MQVYRSFRAGGGNTQLRQEAASSAVKAGMKSKKSKQSTPASNLGAGDV